MTFLFSLVPATLVVVLGYFVLYAAGRAAGLTRAFGRVLAVWLFAVAAAVPVAGAYCTLANVSKSGAPVDVAGSAVTRIPQQANDAGINSELPDLLCDWAKRAQAAGNGSEETAAIIKVIRQNGSS